MTSIVEVIQHYQRSIDNSQNNEARLLHCINKLYNLPIKVEHLQETGVGKTVNSLRKFNGEIGVAAKTLVTKWKAMVAAEEEPMDTTSQTNESEQHNDSNGDEDETNTPQHDDEADENHNRNINSQQQEENKHRSKEKKDKHKDKHKERSSSSSSHKEHGKHSSSSSKHSSDKNEKHKSTSSSSSSSSKDKESHHKESSNSSKHKDKEREKEKIEHKSSKDKHKDQDRDKEKERSDKKREEKEKSKTDKEHNSSHKSSSSSKSKHEDKHSSNSGHSSSSSSKEKERSEKHKSSSKDKERSKEQEKPSSTSNSSSKDKPEHKSSSTSSTSKSTAKDSDSAERKRRHNSDNDSSDFKSPQPKVAKVTQKSSQSTPASKSETSPPQVDEDEADDSFDSSMGANFDDVLGMLNVPLKKSKKSLKSPSTPTANSSSSSNKKDKPSSSSSSNSGTPVTSSSSGKVNGTRVPFSSNNSSSLYSTPSSSKNSTLKPDLLAPTAKLEPLDPSIALELPTISTNYKPMPLNQTVMDCVFNNSSSKPVRTLTDAEAITHGISSKTMRTKIYSGVRTGQTYQVPTLFDMCIRILQKNIDALEYTGGVPFEVLKPVLERATPQQLYVFEDYNPYLMEDSDILWQQHVSRTYRTKKRLENESWREMFIRCQEEEERRLSVLKDSIKASQKIAAAPVRKTQLAFVDSMVKPPRNVAKKQEQFGTKSKMIATPAARVAALSNVTPNAAKVGDQRLRVPSTARDHAQVSSSSIRPKKAPLMQKTLQFIRGRHKR